MMGRAPTRLLARERQSIGQLLAGGVADHVRMNLEGRAGLLAGPLHHPIEAVPGERAPPRSDVNTNADLGSCSFCSFRNARSSSPRI